jgi:choline dehydrogenase-like flavoprotein
MLVRDIARLNADAASRRIVVIGAGAVGLYTAVELSRRGRDVLVIESGSAQLGGFSTDSFASVGRKHEGIHRSRSRSLGGTTNLWGGQLVAFMPIDFAGREWLPGSAWPVTYDEIAPFYRPTYLNLGLDEQIVDDAAVWRSISARPPPLNDEVECFLTRWLRVPGFAKLYAKRIESDPHLTVLTEHTAVGFRGLGGRITGVRVVDAAAGRHWIEGATFILAAGTIENARLLLHAAADDSWACPWGSNAHVGTRFMDHLGGRLADIHPMDKKKFFKTFCTIVRSGNKFQPKVRLRDAVLGRERQLNIQGLLAFESSASEHLVYLKQFLRASVNSRRITSVRDAARAVGGARYLLPLMWRYAWDHRVFVPSTSRIQLWMQSEQVPLPESRITIDPTHRDAFGLPRVVLDWRIGEAELPSMREFALRIDRALRAGGHATLEIDPLLLSADPRFLDTLHDTSHHAGGAIMGRSAAEGVVDRDLRVFETENLYVGGASVFRTIGNANVTLTALALATRLVYLLAGEHPTR